MMKRKARQRIRESLDRKFQLQMYLILKLPHLEVLHLMNYAFEGPRWDATDGEFVRLKYLYIEGSDLKYWTAESNHFPMLERLFLQCSELEDIPIGLGEISTLHMIDLHKCKPSVITPARQMLEERDNLGYECLQIWYYYEEQDCWKRIEIIEEE